MIRATGLEGRALTAGASDSFSRRGSNAAGRLESAMRGVELLLATSDQEANPIARELEELNARRQEIDRATLEQVRERVARAGLAVHVRHRARRARVASRRHRHRRVANRRGVRTADDAHRARGRHGEGIRPFDQRVRSARRPLRVSRPAAAVRRTPLGGGHHDRGGSRRRVRRAIQRGRALAAHRRRSRSRAARRPRGAARSGERRPRVAAAPPRAVRHGESVAAAVVARPHRRRAAARRRHGRPQARL